MMAYVLKNALHLLETTIVNVLQLSKERTAQR
jgi:hypothetical protein